MGDHTVGNSLDITGDGTGDGTEDGAVARKPTADTVRQLDFARHQGQVGHCSRQVQLESRLGASEVAGLANAQLDQSGNLCSTTTRRARYSSYPALCCNARACCRRASWGWISTAVPSCPWPRCTETAGDMSYIRTRRTGRPASGVSDPRHPYAVPLALWCG